MKKLLLALVFMASFGYVFSQELYSSTSPTNAFSPGVGANGTPIIFFDDVNIPSATAAMGDSVAITKLTVALFRPANADSAYANVYYTIVDDTATLYDNLIKIPPVLIGRFKLPANDTSRRFALLTIGDSINPIFKIKTDTGYLYTGYQTIFVGISIEDTSESNLILLASGGPNDDVMWGYDVDDQTAPRFATGFGGTNPPAATFYMEVYGSASNSLPITLSRFTGARVDGVNLLSWTTKTEHNNTGFELQRSADGNNFSPLTFVQSKAANGVSSSTLNYQFADKSPLKGNGYYRLKQIDKDGKSTLSDVVLIKGLKPATLSLSNVYPNPATTELRVELASPANEKISLVVTDIAGKVVMQQAKEVIEGFNSTVLNVAKLPAGSYMVKAICASGCETAISKFVKK